MANNEITLDISTLWRVLKKHAVTVIIFTVIATILAGVLAVGVLQKKYSASAKLYVENRVSDQTIMNLTDFNTAKSIANTCIELFSTNSMAGKLLDSTGLDYSVGEIKKMISMSTSNNTEFVNITVTMDDAQIAANTLNTLVNLCEEEFNDFINSGRIKIADPAVAGSSPVFPNTKLFLAAGFLAGFAVSFLIVFVIEILDTKVKAEDDLFQIYDVPVFSEILNFDVSVKGDYGYEYK